MHTVSYPTSWNCFLFFLHFKMDFFPIVLSPISNKLPQGGLLENLYFPHRRQTCPLHHQALLSLPETQRCGILVGNLSPVRGLSIEARLRPWCQQKVMSTAVLSRRHCWGSVCVQISGDRAQGSWRSPWLPRVQGPRCWAVQPPVGSAHQFCWAVAAAVPPPIPLAIWRSLSAPTLPVRDLGISLTCSQLLSLVAPLISNHWWGITFS